MSNLEYIKVAPYFHLICEHKPREQFKVKFTYNTGGSWFEQKADRGRKHLLEHCIASRTKDLDFKNFKDFQFKNNLSMNAYTGPIEMGLTASGHFSDQVNLVDTTLEMAFEPTFDQEILTQEKEIVLKEIAERSGQPNYRLHFAVMSQILENHSFENHQVLGDSEQVAKTEIADFHNLLSQNLNQSNFCLLVSGKNIDVARIQKLSQNYLSKLPVNQERLPLNFYPGTFFKDFKTKPVVNVLAHQHADVDLYIPIKTAPGQKPARKIFEELFLSYHGKIYDRLRDDLGLIYSMQGGFDFQGEFMYISFSAQIEDIKKILAEIKTCLSDFESNFNSEKLTWLKAMMNKRLAISKDNLGEESNFLYGELTTYNTARTIDEYIEIFEKTSVEELKTLYNQVRENLEKSKIVIVSNDEKIKDFETFYW